MQGYQAYLKIYQDGTSHVIINGRQAVSMGAKSKPTADKST
jgi:hypothetical protein